jgi:hypothetical protein
MTKTTEELKRKMYISLSDAKLWSGTIQSAETTLDVFEMRLEAYLEALRQESIAKDVRIDHLERMGDVMRDGYMYQQSLTVQARSEADRERNRRQAFEFANQSAGEFLQQARAKIKAQRQSIGQLKNERDNARFTEKVRNTQLQKARQELSEMRKSVGSTSGQSSTENSSESILGGLQRICQHSFRVHHAYPSGKLESQCIFCLKVEG